MPRVTLHSGQYHFVVRGGISVKPTHSRWNHSFSHCNRLAFRVSQLIYKATYIIVLTSNHGTEAHPVAETVSRLLRINDIALVVNLIKNFLNGTPFAPIFLLFLGTGLFASGCFPFADTDRGGTFGTSSDNSWCWAFGALAGLTRFSRSWCIASCTGTARSINGRRSCQRRWLYARRFTPGRGWSFQRKWFWNVRRGSRYTS